MDNPTQNAGGAAQAATQDVSQVAATQASGQGAGAGTAQEAGVVAGGAADPTATALFVSAFFDELERAGVHDVVLSPGSRSTPLSMIAYASPTLNTYVDVDERGAAFFALGIAKANKRPVAIVCTSGTAVANYYPAVMEAETSRVPLIVLSGDRPARLQKLGAPQTCDQLHAFGSHVRRFWQLPEPSANPSAIAYARQIAREAVLAAAPGGVSAAPVHLNFPFDEPLKPNLQAPGLFSVGRAQGSDVLPEIINFSFATPVAQTADAAGLANIVALLRTKRVIAFCGEDTVASPAFAKQRAAQAQTLFAWAEHFDVPLMADPLSGVRTFTHEAVIDNYDSIFGHEDVPAFDVVVRFGRYPVSKRAYKALETTLHIQIVVDPCETRDYNAATSTIVATDPLSFMQACLQADGANAAQGSGEIKSSINKQSTLGEGATNTSEAGIATDTAASTEAAGARGAATYISRWAACNEEARQRIVAVRDAADNSFEGTYVHHLLESLPEQALFFTANSMSVRAVDTFYVKQNKEITVLCNRGLNGIDGTLSTAFGAAQAFDQAVLLTGDLTFLHDLNALHLQNEMLIREQEGHKRPCIVVVVLNNAGGAIFDMLPQKSDDAYFKRLFLTPQQLSIKAAAEAFYVPYRKASSREEFDRALHDLYGNAGINIIEVTVPLQGVRDRYVPYQ